MSRGLTPISPPTFSTPTPMALCIDRKAFLAQIGHGSPVKNIREHDVVIRILGEFAIIHARTSYQKQYTDDWQLRDGRWQCVSAHLKHVKIRCPLSQRAGYLFPAALKNRLRVSAFAVGGSSGKSRIVSSAWLARTPTPAGAASIFNAQGLTHVISHVWTGTVATSPDTGSCALKEICLSRVGGRATKILKAARATALEFRKPPRAFPTLLFGSRKVLAQRLEFNQRGAARFIE
jgi:hypothetical protein